MKNYLVTWEIDIEAASAEDAARQALDIQRDPLSWATVFDVTDVDTKETTRIDLDGIDAE